MKQETIYELIRFRNKWGCILESDGYGEKIYFASSTSDILEKIEEKYKNSDITNAINWRNIEAGENKKKAKQNYKTLLNIFVKLENEYHKSKGIYEEAKISNRVHGTEDEITILLYFDIMEYNQFEIQICNIRRRKSQKTVELIVKNKKLIYPKYKKKFIEKYAIKSNDYEKIINFIKRNLNHFVWIASSNFFATGIEVETEIDWKL